MANHASAAKRNRQIIKRTERNRRLRSALRTQLKQARLAIEAGDKKAAAEKVLLASTALARAASKGIIHQNTAARTTSRINSQLGKLS